MAQGRVALLLGEGFEDSEFRIPYDKLKAAGLRVDLIGAEAGKQLSGKKGEEKVKVERAIDEVRADDYAMLFIPGGHSPDLLRADSRFVDFVKAFDEAEKPIAAVCHGPQLLMAADLVKGRTLTAWQTVQKDLELAGAIVKDEEVVVDGNWITSRKPEDLEAFSAAMLAELRDKPQSASSQQQPETKGR